MKKTIIISLCSLLCLCACNDDRFLEENPKYFYTLENAFTTSSQVDQALVHCYSHLRNQYIILNENGTSFAFRGSNGTDMFDVTTIRHGFQFNDYSNITPERAEFLNIYTIWYQLISDANLTLYGAGLENIVWDSEVERRYVIAQARFFRAFAYRNLGEEFGGVPIVTEFCTEARYDYARATRLDTYQFAIDELEQILPDLPETSDERGRIVRGAAQHNLCQLYLDKGIVLSEQGEALKAEEAYKKSISYASDLIGGGLYLLMTERFGTRKDENPQFWYGTTTDAQGKEVKLTYESAGVHMEGNVFWDLFQMGNQSYQSGNTESIWTLNTDLDAYIEEDRAARLSFSRAFSPTFRDPLAGILEGIKEDVGGRGVTWVMPTKYTRDMIFSGKWSGDMRNSESCYRRQFVGNVPGSKYYGKIIPWSVIYKDGQSQSAIDAAYTQCFPISCKVASDIYVDDEMGGNKSYLFRDEYVIRLAETILLRAEARVRTGDYDGAVSDINLIRRRAKCSYMVTTSDISLELILDERARELMYEELRWNTLLRMGGTVATDRIREYSYWDYPRSGTMPQFNLWPIPQKVIDTNKDVLIEQNEGWK